MNDFCKKEYSLLFNGITDTIKELERVIQRLKLLQMKAEELSLLDDDNDCGVSVVTEMGELVNEVVVIEKNLGPPTARG